VVHNHTLTVNAAGVLANDTDPDNDPLSAVLVAGPSNGTLTLNSNGSFTYVPTTGFVGSDSFSYLAGDGIANSNVATVTIAVTDQPPVGNADSYSVAHNHTLTVSAPGVLGNDTDADGDPLTATLVSGVSHGSLTFNSNGSFTYVPATNYMGSDGFTYKAYDGFNYSNVVTVNMSVTNSPPVAQNDSGVTTPMVPVTINVLANDSETDGDPLTVASLMQGTHGYAVINSNMTVTYTPMSSTYYGTDTFSYTISDGHGGTATAMVTVTIGHPQLLDGSPQDPAAAAGLTADQLEPAVVQAISILQAAGYDVSALNQTTVHITNLPPGVLGVTYQNTIWIDETAAGYGWFTDVSLSSADAFAQSVGGNQFLATPDSPANGHIDLLTVVLHEFGHVLGFESIDPTIQSQDWMTATLAAGVRRLPDPAGANSGPLIPFTNPVPGSPDGSLPVGIFDPYFENVLGLDNSLFGDIGNFVLIGSLPA
jgi:hypothetical protein